MRFTLTYRGPLPTKRSAAVKHAIRGHFHEQLRELWQHEPLKGNSAWINRAARRDDGREADDAGAALRETGGHPFAIVVRRDIRLHAELDVLLLRPEHPGAVLVGADIDNRLKVLFDALRYPATQNELPADWSPSPGQSPMHCLLEDDRLVTRVNVETDRLLAPVDVDEVAVTVRVQVRASSPTWASISLIS